jgi:glycosyltransferase involved in cell wall biosynthesis
LERYIANNVEVVTAVSRPLQSKIQGYLGEGTVHLSPNALDTRFLVRRKIQVRPRDGRKVIGYVGHLTAAWFDWEALVHVACSRPHWTVQVVGHSEPKGLDLPKNLELLGPRDYRQIIETAGGWRAALIPFKICRLSDGVDPIKVYEYLAMGLPVVSFRMPQIHDYPYVFIAHDRDQFVARIEEALEVDMDPEVIRRFLAVNRWEDRVDQILSWPAEPRLDPIRAVGTAERA